MSPPASSSPCAPTGADKARKGVSSLDSRRRSVRVADGAALLRRASQRATAETRDAILTQLVLDGHSQTAIGAAFGLDGTRVGQIYRKNTTPDQREALEVRRRCAARESRADLFLVWYRAGLTLKEIGAKFGESDVTVGNDLRGHPDYRPRRLRRRGYHFDGDIPPWLPVRYHERFKRIAAGNGEEIAAACLSKLKALEAGG